MRYVTTEPHNQMRGFTKIGMHRNPIMNTRVSGGRKREINYQGNGLVELKTPEYNKRQPTSTGMYTTNK